MRSRGRAIRHVAVVSVSAAFIVACAADDGDPLKVASDITAESDGGGGLGGGDGGSLPSTDSSLPPKTDASTSTDSGVKDTGTKDTGPGTPSCTTCPIAVRYMTSTTGSEQNLRPRFDLYNNGTSAQDLTELTVRYWFTSENSNNLTYECDYAFVGCGNTKGSFGTVAGKATADHYLELGFTGGTPIAPGGHSGEIQTRLHDSGYAVTFTQTNDYSFDASKTAYAEWDHVTVYRGGTLIFGVEP